ncbi:hypothetical protein BO71DRAFT_426027 [Aspergillus ellipticus CBS 707.79]|uniref:Uncharacterized protein n=1 Tax=Aspergillus ellipticus CBS 707.79 TaxID=1448320 RepID=A0A319DMG5_9EURO|nr:hypothetical protein BO71DRAFT_426027 [Aspergillus ellipticus CBS 707.79]
MTIPYPLIGPESYGLGRKSVRRTPSTPGPSTAEPALKDLMSANSSQEHLDACSKASSGHGWRAKLSRKFHLP